MKIDLHCHTKRIKSGDGPGRNVTKDLFRKKIYDSDVKIVAITNHNTFDKEQFCDFRDAVSENCQLWPGVEIDIQQFNRSRWHLIVIANPDNLNVFSESVNLLFNGKNLETCTHTIKEVYDCLNKCDVIYIAHFHKKPAISEEDRQDLLDIVGDNSRVFNEAPDNRTLGVFANYGYNVMIGSDVSDWGEYEHSTFADLRLPISNFHQFCMLAKRDETIINTLLNKRESYKLIASPHKSVKIPITIFQDVNIIFGQKGTGKSEILSSLYEQMLAKGMNCKKYTGSEKDNDFKSLLKTQDMDRNLSYLQVDGCEKEFSEILEWKDTNPTMFQNYIDWYKTKDNNKNKSRMKITDSTKLLNNPPESFTTYSSDRTNIKKLLKTFNSISYKLYLDNNDISLIEKLLTKIEQSNLELLAKDVIDSKSTDLTNYSIEKIKNIADRNSDTVSKPSSTGFIEFATNRLTLLKNIKKIKENLSKPEYNEKNHLGTIEEKGNLYINKKYRLICENSKTTEFSIGIKKLKAVIDTINDIESHIEASTISAEIDILRQLCSEDNITSLKPFIGLSKQIVTESNEEYTPSNGEKGILLLERTLSEEADAYFLDEPELGMGNSFIDTNIRPIISALAKQHKTVVIATHNANIAVRTLPYMSILRTHQNGNYNTYIGNPFDDKLKNINDENDIKSWTTESLHTLEGGKEAFYERKSIYETSGE